MTIEDLMNFIGGLNYDDLLALSAYIDEEVAKKSPDDMAHFYFTEIKTALLSRFTSFDIDDQLEWRELPREQKLKFKVAWKKAIDFLKEEKGFTNTAEKLCLKLITGSTVIRSARFSQIMYGLKTINALFNQAFPNYNSKALEMLDQVLQ